MPLQRRSPAGPPPNAGTSFLPSIKDSGAPLKEGHQLLLPPDADEIPIHLPARAVSAHYAGDIGGAVLIQLPPSFDLEGDVGVVGRCCATMPRGFSPPAHGSSGPSEHHRDRPQPQVLDIKGDLYELSSPLQLAGTCMVLKIGPGKGRAGRREDWLFTGEKRPLMLASIPSPSPTSQVVWEALPRFSTCLTH